MELSDNAMSAILLTSYIGIQDVDRKPFSMGEWNLFLEKIREHHQIPALILSQDIDVLKEMGYQNETLERIKTLVQRGGAVAFEMESLEKKGIEVVTIFDSDYPVLLRKRLKKKAPPVLFYSGNIELAKKIGIGTAGSRNIDEDGILFTKKLAEKASMEKLLIYSGGARGADMISEQTAVGMGGAAVSFLADSLLSRIRRKEVIDALIRGKLLLFSDVKPDAGFSAARAMNRNKYIYASAYGTFVIASDYRKGGTWAGAVEALKNNWGSVFVWDHGRYDGNSKLIGMGGIPYELSDKRLYEIITEKRSSYRQMEFSLSDSELMVSEKKSGLYG